MRTERRQDLRTNELSHQLDAIREYAKKNAAAMTIIVVVAVVVVGASLAYAKWQNDRRMEAWDTVTNVNTTSDAAKAIDKLEVVVAENVTPGATCAALLKIAETALHESIVPPQESKDQTAPAPATTTVDWVAKARDAYTRVLEQFPNDKVASGQAMIALGVMAEDKGDIEKARDWYKKVTEHKDLLHTSLIAQAHYRLAHLDEWAKPIVFPPPQMTVEMPDDKGAEANTVSKAPASAPPVRGPAAATPPSAPPVQPSQPRPGTQSPLNPPPAAPSPPPGQGASP